MDLYTDPEKLDAYEKMCEGYDGSALYSRLEKHLNAGKSLLELGSGPGNDMAYLKDKFAATASDFSDEFLTRLKSKYVALPLLKLDAQTIDTSERFDCIFSNKVLQHLTVEALDASFKRQQQVLRANGIFAHSFWLGDKSFTMDDMLFVFQQKAVLLAAVSKYFTVIETYTYSEFDEGDSIFIIAKNSTTH